MVTGISESTQIWHKGRRVEAFGPTMGIATAIIALGIAFWVAVGKERKGSHFEVAAAAGAENANASNSKPIDMAAERAMSPGNEKDLDLEGAPCDKNSSEKGAEVQTLTKDA